MSICIFYTSNLRILVYLIILAIYLFNQISVSHCLQPQQKHDQAQVGFQTNKYSKKCGSMEIPFPFYLNSSSSSDSRGGLLLEVVSEAFCLTCVVQQQQQQTSQIIYLDISSQKYRVIEFFTDGVLVDYVVNTSLDSPCTSPYIDLGAFIFEGNDYFGISPDNVVGLYGCQDSSLCKLAPEPALPLPHSCEVKQNETCDGSGSSCCYSLSEGGRLQLGADRGFSVFSQYGCRGFSSWIVVPSPSKTCTNVRKRGVKLEWAIPRNSSKAECAPNAYTVNSTSVPSGIRCQCPIGFVGDAFAHGDGCFKSCLKDGRQAYGEDCITKTIYHTRKVKVLVGVVASGLCLASLTAIFCLLKQRSNKPSVLISDKESYYDEGENIPSGKSSNTRLFSYDELEQATKGFDDSQKLVEGTKGSLYAGVLGDGSHVAVHKLQKSSKYQQYYLIEEKELVSKFAKVLSALPHKNLAPVLGCCINTPLLVVYEYPNYGTLENYLLHSRDEKNNVLAGGGAQARVGLEWCKRLKVASETAGLLAFLRYNICPPVIHQDLHPGFIFLDYDCSIKVAGFVPSSGHLPETNNKDRNHVEGEGGMLQFCTSDDVYSIGLLLLDLISGVGEKRFSPTKALGKIRSGKVEEIVDPLIYYEDHREEIEIVADLATRCLLFGSKLGMINVAKELKHLLHLKQQTVGTSNSSATTLSLLGSTSSGSSSQIALDETFSNSSLLQMISMSPDSIYAPHF